MAQNPSVFCVNCGSENPSDARFCRQCGQGLEVSQPPPPPPFTGQGQPHQGPSGPFTTQPPPQYGAAPTHIDNYLIWAILVTICCCWPAGIVSIIYAAQVNGKLSTGDIAGARRSSEAAKNWAIASAGLGLAVYVIVGIFYACLGLLALI